MEINAMQMEDIQTRMAEIKGLLDSEDADVEALSAEVDQLEARSAEIRAQAEARSELVAKIANGNLGEVIESRTDKVEVKEPMNLEEVRSSAAYENAYANYIKTGNDAECRALLSDLATSGTVPTATMVDSLVRTAWDREGIMRRVKKAYLKGSLKVGFEMSADDAAIHTEGGDAVNEENLTLGIVTLTPASIKKWISISDEAMDLTGGEFLRYVYDEIAYKIAKKAADTLVADIIACGTVSTATCPVVPVLAEATVGVGTIAKAIANLSDQASEPVIMMNKLTWAAFKAAQYANNYGVDPFEGLPVEFNNSITAYSAATTGVTYAIVGDLGYGALANFPNGEEITFKFDDLTLATSDLVKIVGREYVGLGVVAPKAFVKITK